MTLRHLQIFLAVCQTGSFTKAAEKLYLTQSAVSHAIRELEDQAGTPFFDRLSKSIVLTPTGALFWEQCAPIVASCEKLEATMGQLEQTAPLRVVTSITIASFWLADALAQFAKIWPQVPVEVEVVSAASATRRLREANADFALLEGARPQGPFCCQSFASYRLLALCAPSYPSPQVPLSLCALCEYPLLLREKGSAIRDAFDSLLLLHGHSARPLWTSVDSIALVEAAKAGLGIAILPELFVEKECEQGELLSLQVEDFQIQNEALVVWHRDKHLTAPLSDLLKSLCSLSCTL